MRHCHLPYPTLTLSCPASERARSSTSASVVRTPPSSVTCGRNVGASGTAAASRRISACSLSDSGAAGWAGQMRGQPVHAGSTRLGAGGGSGGGSGGSLQNVLIGGAAAALAPLGMTQSE